MMFTEGCVFECFSGLLRNYVYIVDRVGFPPMLFSSREGILW